VLGRADAYIGVLIDDLVTRGVTEPYRMFTSRAEYRLKLRADNADQRLTGLGLEWGCVGAVRAAHFAAKSAALAEARAKLGALTITPSKATGFGLALNQDGVSRSAFDLLGYPNVKWADLCRIRPELQGIRADVVEQLEIDAGYAGYLDRQEADIVAFRRDEELKLPPDLDYASVGGLSAEMQERLSRARPVTLGQAARLPGITPAALVALLAHVKKESRRRSA
jgi:tRNA uridine 5-carboxymethylaminomethyl modification enzyme